MSSNCRFAKLRHEGLHRHCLPGSISMMAWLPARYLFPDHNAPAPMHLSCPLCLSLRIAPRPCCDGMAHLHSLGDCKATANTIGKDHASIQLLAPCLYILVFLRSLHSGSLNFKLCGPTQKAAACSGNQLFLPHNQEASHEIQG